MAFGNNISWAKTDFVKGGMLYYVTPMFALCEKLKGELKVRTDICRVCVCVCVSGKNGRGLLSDGVWRSSNAQSPSRMNS